MIISHRLEFAFFRVPKTGSTTTELLLRMTGLFDDNDIASAMPTYGLQTLTLPPREPGRGRTTTPNPAAVLGHMTPETAVEQGHITEAQLESYDCYCTARDPLDRVVSAFAHGVQIPALMNPDTFKRIVIEKNHNFGLLLKPQTDYFMYKGKLVCTPLDFSDFQGGIRTMIEKLLSHPNAGSGINFPVMPNFNRTRGKDLTTNKASMVDSDQVVRDKLLVAHADDIALYESFYAGRRV